MHYHNSSLICFLSMDDVEIGDVSLRATDGAAEDEDGGDTGSSLKIVEVVSLSNSEAPRDDELVSLGK